jgi:hypothetical protein
MFASYSVATLIFRRLYKRLHLASAPKSTFIAVVLLRRITVDGISLAFSLRSWTLAIQGLQNIYFAGHVVLVVLYLGLALSPRSAKSGASGALLAKKAS